MVLCVRSHVKIMKRVHLFQTVLLILLTKILAVR